MLASRAFMIDVHHWWEIYSKVNHLKFSTGSIVSVVKNVMFPVAVLQMLIIVMKVTIRRRDSITAAEMLAEGCTAIICSILHSTPCIKVRYYAVRHRTNFKNTATHDYKNLSVGTRVIVGNYYEVPRKMQNKHNFFNNTKTCFICEYCIADICPYSVIIWGKVDEPMHAILFEVSMGQTLWYK